MLMALILAVTTVRGTAEAAKFKRDVLMPPKCYVNGAIKKRKEKLKNGGFKLVRDCIIDHIIPLRCGGPDVEANMQWQTYSESLVKDKTERLCK